MEQDNELETVNSALSSILSVIQEDENKYGKLLSQVHPEHSTSARNLLNYLSVRMHDLRAFQRILAKHGLSSIGRSEAFIKSSLENIVHFLNSCQSKELTSEPTMSNADSLLDKNVTNLLGASPEERKVRVMVTLGIEAAEDENLSFRLLKSGMNCVRINCAHDDRKTWEKIIQNTRKATIATGIPCKILMDIAGPKIRTGKIKKGPKVVKIVPTKDALGTVLKPAEVGLGTAEFNIRNGIPTFQISPSFSEHLTAGKKIYFHDARGRKRKFKTSYNDNDGNWICHSRRTSYIIPGTKLKLYNKKEKITDRIGDIPGIESEIRLQKGDTLLLFKENIPGEPAQIDNTGKVIKPACISCTNSDIFDDVEAGNSILFDDGKIGGLITAVNPEALVVTITEAADKGTVLKADKGINFPDSVLKSVKTLSEKDMRDLGFVAKNADIVNLSFINSAKDVELLLDTLEKLDARDLGVMVKIETRTAVTNLPEIIFTLQKAKKPGIMIARGDLAIEAGWTRMAEIQEEILWLAEAAHLPVVWATQVLESLAKKGLPSRAEITDAAMSQRADCVMLNKGSYIVRAIQVLDDILIRMKDHQKKKTPMLRKLSLAENFLNRKKENV